MKEITIEIDRQGNVKVEGFGFVGDECKQFTQDLEEALGEVEKVEFKPEHSLTRTTTNRVAR